MAVLGTLYYLYVISLVLCDASSNFLLPIRPITLLAIAGIVVIVVSNFFIQVAKSETITKLRG